MAIRFDRDGQDFRRLTASRTFVDQTMLLSRVNECVGSEHCFLCVSRPRRFGKSVIASMLECYYSRGSAGDPFAGLEICRHESYAQRRGQYHVIRITLTDYFTHGAHANTASEMVTDFQADLSACLQEQFADLLSDTRVQARVQTQDQTRMQDQAQGQASMPISADPARLLSAIYKVRHEPFIFILDEWDALMRRFPHDEAGKKFYLDKLLALFKGQEYVALAYMTGILPIRKYGEHSALNMFTEYSMLNAKGFAPYTGFTDEEVEELCRRFDLDYNTCRAWYDGYRVRGERGEMYSVYNPLSVTEALRNGFCESYWTATESYEALRRYIVMNLDSLKEKVQYLTDGGRLAIRVTDFNNDLAGFTKADSVLTALIHLGYLTIERETDTAQEYIGSENNGEEYVRIPNKEVLSEFRNTLAGADSYAGLSLRLRNSEKLLRATLDGDEQRVAEYVRRAHSLYADALHYNSEESLTAVLTQAYQFGYLYYTIRREMPAGEGFADLYFEPLRTSAYPPMLVELKWRGDAETAITQARDRNYLWVVQDSSYKEALVVGISYDRQTKEHHCRIEKVPIEW